MLKFVLQQIFSYTIKKKQVYKFSLKERYLNNKAVIKTQKDGSSKLKKRVRKTKA